MNIKKYAKVDFEKIIVRRDSLFDDQIDMNHNMVVFTNMAYSDKQNVAQNKQPYLRYYINTCVREYDDKGNPKPGTRMNKLYHQTGYTTGNYAKTMFLQDLTDENLVKQYAYDEWVIQPWYTKGNSGDKKPFSQIYPREKIREAGYKAATPNLYLWDENAVDFANPSMTSMYNEPVIICRVMKVKDRGKKATRTTDGKRIVKEYLCSFFGDDNNRNEPEFDDYSTIDAMSGLFSSSPYNYNGWDTKSPSPGWPTIKVVRSTTPGTFSRIALIRRRVPSESIWRRILLRTPSEICWRGMSIYLQTLGLEAIWSSTSWGKSAGYE